MNQPKIDNEYMRILLGDAEDFIDTARGILIDTDRRTPEEIAEDTIGRLEQAELRIMKVITVLRMWGSE